MSYLSEMMERYLPCPPTPLPEPGSDADYLWRATLVNTRRDPPLHVVKLLQHRPLPLLHPGEIDINAVMHLVRVECDARGRGVMVLR